MDSKTGDSEPYVPFAGSAVGRKKALLIGIVYEFANNDRTLMLKGPHNDVFQLKRLLLDRYDFKEENIRTLMDDGKHEMPNKENIINGMAWLVKDARANDSLLFHYSGHGDQIPGNSEEEDNNDEAIIPCDADFDNSDTWIRDDLMNDYLVKTLPAKCRLTAIFDSCHSGTALDLDHYCNRFYVPWVSRGRRRTSFLRNRLLRRDALFSALTPDDSHSTVQGQVSISRRMSPTRVVKETIMVDVQSDTTKQARRLSLTSRTTTLKLDCSCANIPSPSPQSPTSSKIYDMESPIASSSSTTSSMLSSPLLRRILNSIDNYPWQPFRLFQQSHDDVLTTSSPITPTSPMSITSVQENSSCICSSCKTWKRASVRRLELSKIITQSIPSSSSTSTSSSTTPVQCSPSCLYSSNQCTSPIPLYGCPGSRLSSPVREKAQVFSISACNDGQQAYEDPKGMSMTAALVDFLKNDPHPTFKMLMTSISHKMWNTANSMNQQYKRLKKRKFGAAVKVKDHGPGVLFSDTFEAEFDDLKCTIESGAIQEPLLGSTKKVNMDEDIFTL